MDNTTPSTDPWCKSLQCPSAHGSCHEPEFGTTSSTAARTGREHTWHNFHPAVRHSFRRCSMGKNRWWCLEIFQHVKIFIYNSVQPASNSPTIQTISLHVEQSSKQEHNPLLQSLDILLLSSKKQKLTRITHLLSQSEQKNERNSGVVAHPWPRPRLRAAPQTRPVKFLHPNTHNEPMTVQAGPKHRNYIFKRAKARGTFGVIVEH